MSPIWRACLAALLLAVTGCGAAAPASAPAPQAEEPALWRLSDADSTVYIFGGIHLLPAELAWRGPAFDAALADAKRVVLEAPTDAAASAALAGIVAARGLNPPGVTLSSQLAQEDQAKLAAAAARVGVAMPELERLRPWFAAVRLSIAFVTAGGRQADFGVERVLEAEAARAGKPVGYLETLEQQIGFFAGLSPAAERRYLMATLREFDRGAGQVEAVEQAWARGDVRTLEKLLGESFGDAGPEVEEALLTRRNIAWTAEIAALLAGEEDVLVAVGAAHLIGDGSVVALLRARGLPVEGP